MGGSLLGAASWINRVASEICLVSALFFFCCFFYFHRGNWASLPTLGACTRRGLFSLAFLGIGFVVSRVGQRGPVVPPGDAETFGTRLWRSIRCCDEYMWECSRIRHSMEGRQQRTGEGDVRMLQSVRRLQLWSSRWGWEAWRVLMLSWRRRRDRSVELLIRRGLLRTWELGSATAVPEMLLFFVCRGDMCCVTKTW